MTELGSIPYPVQGIPLEKHEWLPSPVVEESVPNPEVSPESHIRIFLSTDPDIGDQVKLLSQQLHTEVYLENGLITEDDLNPLGLYIDKYADRSTYLFVKNGHKVAAARQIYCDKKEGILSLPTPHCFSVDPQKLSEAAGVGSVADIRPKEVVEISGLVARRQEGGVSGNLDAVIALYSQMLRSSLESGHKLWVLNVEPLFLRRLGKLVGHDQMHILGEPQEYMGPATIPVAINPQSVVRKLLDSTKVADEVYKDHLRFVFSGINDKRVPKDIRELLVEKDIASSRYPKAKRIATNPQVMLQAGILAYSATRAFPAVGVHEFHGGLATLLSIDISTSVPYTYGMAKMYTAKSIGRKALGAAVAVPTFLAPYAYFYAEGNEYPRYVNGVAAAFIGSAVAKEAVSRWRHNDKKSKLTEGLRSLPEDILELHD